MIGKDLLQLRGMPRETITEILDTAEVVAVEKDTSTSRLLRRGPGSGTVKAGDAVVVAPRH